MLCFSGEVFQMPLLDLKGC